MVLYVFLLRTFVMDTIQAFSLRFLTTAVQLCPVYDDQIILPAQPNSFKCPATYQPFYKFTYRFLQFFWFHSLKVIVDGFPVWQFRKFLSAQIPLCLLPFTP